MDMLLRNTGFVALAQMLERHRTCSSIPHLIDPAARKRARRAAKKNGVWKAIESDLDPTRDIAVLKRSVFRQFARNGNRTRNLAATAARRRQLDLAALALWLDHPKAELDYLQDLLWAYCDDWTWIMAAHEHCVVDLGAAMLGAHFAEITAALVDRIEPEVTQRVHAEIERRIFRNVINYDNTEFWHTAYMNWNHVCNGGVIRAALLTIKEPRSLARLIHPMIQNMTYAFDGFTDDGGCKEGPGYWGFGFGHFVQAAHALHCRTGGELNLMADEKIEKICRFPLAAHIAGPYRATYSDSGHGEISVLTALQVNRFYDIPELYELCPQAPSGKSGGKRALRASDLHSLGLYNGEKATGTLEAKDCLLPELGLVKMHGKPGPKQMTLVAVAGYNDVPHNHNDIGTFMLHAGERMVLVDPGSPQYNKQTFREHRYDILYCRTKGHSVPIINGREQKAGKQYRATVTAEGLDGDGLKRAVLDMSRAYPRGTVKQFIRTFELNAADNGLTIEDAYQFKTAPESVEEAFVTFEKAALIRKGKAVRIGPARGGVILTAQQPGRFRVETVIEKPEHTKAGTPDLQRITFVPRDLSTEFALRFSIQESRR